MNASRRLERLDSLSLSLWVPPSPLTVPSLYLNIDLHCVYCHLIYMYPNTPIPNQDSLNSTLSTSSFSPSPPAHFSHISLSLSLSLSLPPSLSLSVFLMEIGRSTWFCLYDLHNFLHTPHSPYMSQVLLDKS